MRSCREVEGPAQLVDSGRRQHGASLALPGLLRYWEPEPASSFPCSQPAIYGCRRRLETVERLHCFVWEMRWKVRPWGVRIGEEQEGRPERGSRRTWQNSQRGRVRSCRRRTAYRARVGWARLSWLRQSHLEPGIQPPSRRTNTLLVTTKKRYNFLFCCLRTPLVAESRRAGARVRGHQRPNRLLVSNYAAGV